jgi:flagellar biosynthetic protein FliQ
MTAVLAADLLRNAIALGLVVAGPMLLAALVVGVLVSLVQAVTQVQEQSLTFLPKLLTVALVFVLTLPWTTRAMAEFTVRMFQTMAMVGR